MSPGTGESIVTGTVATTGACTGWGRVNNRRDDRGFDRCEQRARGRDGPQIDVLAPPR